MAQGHVGQGVNGGTGMCRAWDGTGEHGDVHSGRGVVWGTGSAPRYGSPPCTPPQVKMTLQGMPAHETPIAFEELEGTCRTPYGYNGAGTAQLPLAALTLALALLHSLLS